MKKKVALLIDGGHLRIIAGKKAGFRYDPDFIEKFAHNCFDQNYEELTKVLYYDCAPYSGVQKKPVSGEESVFEGNDGWLHDLAKREYFAVRRGVLKFRGWKPKSVPITAHELKDEDFRPDFEQKGVDMRIGLDISKIAQNKNVERVILVTADTDFIPAMKLGRIEGLQIVAAQLPTGFHTPEFLAHVDIIRPVVWPNAPKQSRIP